MTRKPKTPYFWLETFSEEKVEEAAFTLSKDRHKEQSRSKLILTIFIFLVLITIYAIPKEPKPKQIPKPKIRKLNFFDKVKKYHYANWDDFLKSKKSIRGDYYLSRKEYKKAFITISKAVTDSPYDWRPRVKLFQAYTQCCLETERYCGNAQKEYRSLWQYLPPRSVSKDIRQKIVSDRELVRKKLIRKFIRNGEKDKLLKSAKKFVNVECLTVL